MLSCLLTHSLEVNLSACGRHIEKEILGEGTVLDIGQDLLHSLLGILCDDLRSGDIITVLSCVGDGVTHSCETTLIDQIYDQLHLMDALEVSISRIIACLTKSLEACLHQCAYTAAKNCLLTEEVCLCLGTEGCLKNTCSCAADSLRRKPVPYPERGL